MKTLKLNYLTDKELKSLSRDDANLQIALGLRSCKTLADVTELLQDVRVHEKYLFKLFLEQKRQEEIESSNESPKCHNRIGLLNELLEELKQ